MQQHKHIKKKKENEKEREKKDCFPKLVINIDPALE